MYLHLNPGDLPFPNGIFIAALTACSSGNARTGSIVIPAYLRGVAYKPNRCFTGDGIYNPAMKLNNFDFIFVLA